jgi:osmotically-inducible protein OsmY
MKTETRTETKTDAELLNDVQRELQWEPGLDGANIGVSVRDGVVTLTGTVPTYAQKWIAERTVYRVYGVKAVANDIEVRLTGDIPADPDIARAARNALEWDVEVPADRITVTVSNGWVKLEGEVEWEYQREAAERDVRSLKGVKGVSNLIIVKPKVAPEDLKSRIEEALKRHAELEARRIRVESDGSKVILLGQVRSWAEREAAESAAWSALGVTEVDNRLEVVP